MTFNFGWIPVIQQELRRYFASFTQGERADSALQPAAIGNTVQAFDADLTAIAALTGTGGIERTGAGTAATYALTSYGKSLVAAANASDGRGVLGLTIGANVQAWNTNLDGLAGLSTTGIIERTGPGSFTTFAQISAAKIADNSIPDSKLAGGITAKAWVNFNGFGTLAIRASANVSSITKHSDGDYTINFSTALPDTNYATVINTNRGATNPIVANNSRLADELAAPTTTSVRIAHGVADVNRTFQREDATIISVAIFR